MITTVLFVSFFFMLIIGMPIAVCLGMSSVFTLLYAINFVPKFASLSLSIVATNTYTGIAKFLLLAIPFFVLSGNIMAKAGISTRLVKFIDDCVGHRRGGMAIVCVVVACFFGAISGSGPATVAALGAVLIPAMLVSGFSASFSSSCSGMSASAASASSSAVNVIGSEITLVALNLGKPSCALPLPLSQLNVAAQVTVYMPSGISVTTHDPLLV